MVQVSECAPGREQRPSPGQKKRKDGSSVLQHRKTLKEQVAPYREILEIQIAPYLREFREILEKAVVASENYDMDMAQNTRWKAAFVHKTTRAAVKKFLLQCKGFLVEYKKAIRPFVEEFRGFRLEYDRLREKCNESFE